MSSVDNPLQQKLDGLAQALQAADGHVNDEVLGDAGQISAHGAERLKLSGQHTIVALAGATGSGKSSLFNAISDLELAGTGLRRPTTSWALACAWGPDGAQELLEWMGIPPRHQVSRMGMLDRSSDDTRLDGLVLLDLPDHDSTEVAHHVEMERLVPYSDLLVWVLDPQKYADAAIHERYIRPMAAQADAMVVVLNQIDRVPFELRDSAVEDLKRIMGSAGLGQVPVFAVSATRGDGIDDLKRHLAQRIRDRSAARMRLETQINERVEVLVDRLGVARVPGIHQPDKDAFMDGLTQAAAVEETHISLKRTRLRDGSAYLRWPPMTLIGRSRKDEVSEVTEGALSSDDLARTSTELSVNVPTTAQTIRLLAETATAGLKQPWADAVRAVSSVQSDGTATKLHDELAELTPLTGRRPIWWYLAAIVQWLLFAALLGGVVWSIVDVFGVGKNSAVSSWSLGGLRLPWLLAILGVVGAIIISIGGHLALRIGAKRNARKAVTNIQSVLAQVGHEDVIEPIEAVLSDYASFTDGIAIAQGGDAAESITA